jgi:hypothetical protein
MDESEPRKDKSTAEIETYLQELKAEFSKSIRPPKFLLEIVGFIVLCVYAFFTLGIYCANQKAADAAHDTLGEIQKQTTLMRQQLVGSQGATVRVEQPSWEPSPSSKITIALSNNGVVNAIHVNLSGELFSARLPSGNKIGKPIEIQIVDAAIESKRGYSDSKQVPWLPPTVELEKWPGDTVFFFKGSFTYDNGFGDVSKPEAFCFMWLPKWNVAYKGMGNGAGGFSNRDAISKEP